MVALVVSKGSYVLAGIAGVDAFRAVFPSVQMVGMDQKDSSQRHSFGFFNGKVSNTMTDLPDSHAKPSQALAAEAPPARQEGVDGTDSWHSLTEPSDTIEIMKCGDKSSRSKLKRPHRAVSVAWREGFARRWRAVPKLRADCTQAVRRSRGAGASRCLASRESRTGCVPSSLVFCSVLVTARRAPTVLSRHTR